MRATLGHVWCYGNQERMGFDAWFTGFNGPVVSEGTTNVNLPELSERPAGSTGLRHHPGGFASAAKPSESGRGALGPLKDVGGAEAEKSGSEGVAGRVSGS